MKSGEVAVRYGIALDKINDYINRHATFNVKMNFWGDIIIPDDIDIQEFFKPLLAEKEELVKQRAEKEKQRLQKEKEQYDKNEQIRQQKEEFERKEKEAQYHVRIEKLRSQGASGYYEYKVISLTDIGGMFKSNSGRVNIDSMTQILNDLGIDGWHLVTAYSNELGKNAFSSGANGLGLGVNSTVDENILIFERFIKIQ